MKKIIISMVLLFAFLMCITGCSGQNNTPPSSDVNPPATQTVYEKLESLADKLYRKIHVSVVTSTDGISLSAEYVLAGNNVLYSIERLNLFAPDGDISELSPEFKTRLVGTAAVNNGEIKMLDGENVTLPSYEELKGSFNFKETNLKNIVNANNSLQAEVISPSDFYGSSVNAQGMRIDVEYSETALVKMVITYQTENSTVTTTYEFES